MKNRKTDKRPACVKRGNILEPHHDPTLCMRVSPNFVPPSPPPGRAIAAGAISSHSCQSNPVMREQGVGPSPAVCVNGHSSGARERAHTVASMGIGFLLGAPARAKEPGAPVRKTRRGGSGQLCAILLHRADKCRHVCYLTK